MDGLTGADLLAAKEQVVANMLDAVAAARRRPDCRRRGSWTPLARQVADGERSLQPGPQPSPRAMPSTEEASGLVRGGGHVGA